MEGHCGKTGGHYGSVGDDYGSDGPCSSVELREAQWRLEGLSEKCIYTQSISF